jgi:hypothetical protein
MQPSDDRGRRALRALYREFTIIPDGETATAAGEMDIEVVRPADDADARFWLTIRFPGGDTRRKNSAQPAAGSARYWR